MEIMDDFNIRGIVHRDTLDKIELVNRLLGGNKVTIAGLKKLLKNQPKDKMIRIIDLGCGNGDILRDIAMLGRKNNYSFKLIGIDANASAIEYARELSETYPEINFKKINIFSDDFKKQSYDIVLCTLFLHHFSNDELIQILRSTIKSASIGIVVNDLHRNKLAYYLFKFIGYFTKNKVVIEDGLISILRAFKRKDLVKISNQINGKFSIQWKWAFRYLWILKKI
tara:strand:- start:220 stop:894 length:675 start_codon:yes stop_codon:yes gene_type:complete